MLMTMQEVAEYLKVSVNRAYELARIGAIPTVRLGRSIRVDLYQLQRWAEDGGYKLDGGWRREPVDAGAEG